MTIQRLWLFGALAFVFLSGEAMAQTSGNPTAGLERAGEESLVWLLDVASILGAVAIVVVGLLNYAGVIGKEWMIRVIVISAIIIIGPQVIKFIFDVGRGA